MVKSLVCVIVVTACLIPSAAGRTTSGVKALYLSAPIEALALSGNRVAFDLESVDSGAAHHEMTSNQVVVWDVGTGETTRVSGRETRGADGTAVGGVDRLAITGNRVAWRILAGGNTERDDDIYVSSLLTRRARHVAGGTGASDGGGTWVGGVVASGREILVDRWTTDAGGAITDGGLYTLHGTHLRPFADGAEAVEAVAADAHRVAAQHWADGTISVFSASGELLSTVTPDAQPKDVALSGRNLLVLEPHGKLVLYDAQTGAVRKTFTLHRGWQGEPIAVHGNVAVYSAPVIQRRENSVRALNLTTGKDRLVGQLPGQIPHLRMNSFGLVYTNYRYSLHGYDIRLVFVPFPQVAAAVR